MTDIDTSAQADAGEEVVHLERLAAELPTGEYHAQMGTTMGHRPSLHVSNRRVTVLAEDVIVDDGWYWYFCAERLTPVSEVPAAAGKIAQLLRAMGTR
jgi:hypothetical protein